MSEYIINTGGRSWKFMEEYFAKKDAKIKKSGGGVKEVLQDRNNTSFPSEMIKWLKKVPHSDKEVLKYYQKLVKEYVVKNNKVRGILIYYDMGYGKTITSISIAEALSDKYEVMIVASKSLHHNYKKEIKKYMNLEKAKTSKETIPDKEIDNHIKNRYHFISSNAFNMYEQIAKKVMDAEILKKDSDEEFYKNIINNLGNLDGKVIIVDEAHNFFKAITNSETGNARKFYDMIMRSKDVKLIFLTGTPIDSDPFDLVPCFNMLQGYISMGKQKTTLFSENWREFRKYFISKEGNEMINIDKFQDRIVGLVSYYGNTIENEDGSGSSDMPTLLRDKIVKVPMSEKQYIAYENAREKERKEASVGQFGSDKQVGSLSKPKASAASTYRVHSRSISNILIPRRDGVRQDLSQKQLTENLDVYSPKMAQIIKNIKSHGQTKGLIYSQFYENEGIGYFTKALKARGYEEYGVKELDHGEKSKKKRYAIIAGPIPFDRRQALQDVFNLPVNDHGEVIHLLLITSTGAEGLNLKGVRHVHIMEPYWNDARIEQVKYRAVRYKSHTHLPANERNVQSYIYLSDYPNEEARKRHNEYTTDENIYKKALNMKYLIEKFLNVVKLSAIDCAVHRVENSKCRVCEPSNVKLFSGDFYRDMKLRSPCNPYRSKVVKVETVILDDKEYGYTQDPISKKLKFYEPIPNSTGWREVDDPKVIADLESTL